MTRKVTFTVSILALAFMIVTLVISLAQSSSFEVLSTSFKSSAGMDVYPGSRRAYLRIDVQYHGTEDAYSVTGYLKDLPPGISPSFGYGLTSPARDPNGTTKISISQGDIFYFDFYLDVNKGVEPDTYDLTLIVSYKIGTETKSENFRVSIAIAPYPELRIIAVDVSWNPGAYPRTIDASLRVTIRNVGTSDLRNAVAKLLLPEGFRPRELSTQVNPIVAGDQALIQFNDIDIDVGQGSYTAIIDINGTAQTPDGVTYNASASISISIKVEAVASELYVIKPLSAQWGEAQPRPSYPGSRYVPLTITLINGGEYDALGLIVRTSSQYLKPIKAEDTYPARIYPGDSCSLTFYFDVATYAYEKFNLVLDMEYWVDIGGGTLVRVSSRQHIQVFVEEYVGTQGEGIYVVSTGWLNNYNVFPNTDNATYQVVIANRLPFQLRGIKASLTLPLGFRGDMGSIATAYFDGPLTSYSSAALPFRVSVGNVKPGLYEATLTVDYIAESGGPGTRKVEHFNVKMRVIDDKDAIELISATWLASAVEPRTYGAVLRVDLRNNYIDSMNGVILEINLPRGFFSAIDNSSKIKIASTSPEIVQVAQNLPQSIEALISIIRATAISPQQSQQYPRGSTISFLVPLNVLVNSTGIYKATGTVSYIDSWGCRRECKVEVPLTVLGSARYVDVKLLGSMSIKSRYTNMTLVLQNLGSSPAYNVYLTIRATQSALGTSAPLLIATPSTIYLDMLEANATTSIPMVFAFNPLGYQSVMGATTVVNYGVAPLMVSISYKDANGYSHNFDVTVAVALEPFIDVVVRDLKAEASQGALEVSGTLINYGSATAYRLEVGARAGSSSSSSFIGDLEPGSQTAFRIRMQVPENVSDYVKLTISYYNIFNEYDKRELNVTITRIQPKVEEKPVAEAPIPFYGLLMIVLVIIFLALVGILVYRLYRSHMRRLRSGVSTQ
ncbi:MAG: hypothetical protein QW701_01205 [Candidatus Nezhaarchaeales archaeon]